ncbi:olfactory receptor 4K3-like protein [Camelus ferus]|nr:olfactory receptor 4K3-like protein [Camelus ferus]
MIADFLVECKTISFEGCMAQIFFLNVFGGAEMKVLVAMAYDRYVAICRPLHYVTIMSVRKCTSLVAGSWLLGFLHSVSQLVFTVNLPFCGPNKVDSFFCNLPLVIKLACTDTFTVEVLMLSDSGLMAMSSFVLLLVSYTVILVTMRRHSLAGMAKARATLTAHITVVTLFFRPCIFIYAWPFSNLPVDNVLSIFYTVFTPLLNLLIYTLRNKEDRFRASLQPGSMDKVNSSVVSEFVLLGLSSSQELQLFFFIFFSVLYVVIVLGNLLIILMVTSDNSLHSPMYFLLGNLSFVDICQASFATPKMIADFLSEPKTISFSGCIAQIFFIHLFTGGEMVLLVSMAYDRY